jgi:hypothetical protein
MGISKGKLFFVGLLLGIMPLDRWRGLFSKQVPTLDCHLLKGPDFENAASLGIMNIYTQHRHKSESKTKQKATPRGHEKGWEKNSETIYEEEHPKGKR